MTTAFPFTMMQAGMSGGSGHESDALGVWMKPGRQAFEFWVSFFPTAPLFGVEWRFRNMVDPAANPFMMLGIVPGLPGMRAAAMASHPGELDSPAAADEDAAKPVARAAETVGGATIELARVAGEAGKAAARTTNVALKAGADVVKNVVDTEARAADLAEETAKATRRATETAATAVEDAATTVGIAAEEIANRTAETARRTARQAEKTAETAAETGKESVKAAKPGDTGAEAAAKAGKQGAEAGTKAGKETVEKAVKGGKAGAERASKPASEAGDETAETAATARKEAARKANGSAAADGAATAADETAEIVDHAIAAAPKPKMLLDKRPKETDDLTSIKGIGAALARQLNGLGLYRFDQLAQMTDADLAWIDANITRFKGRCFRDDWVGQAKARLSN